jgi:hypothetical protein
VKLCLEQGGYLKSPDYYTADQMRAMFDAATELAAKKEWQTIESAPKHTQVLVWREDSGPFIAKLTTPDAVVTPEEMEREGFEFPDDFEEWWADAYGWQEGSEKPTHWKPLDEPCAAAIRARDGKGET